MDGTAVPCIASWALNPWATREALLSQIFNVSPRFVIAFLLRNKCLDFMATATIHSDFGTQEKKSVIPSTFSQQSWHLILALTLVEVSI